MGLPKRKPSLSRQGMRRAHHALKVPGVTSCPRCHTVKFPHRICPTCGYYKGEAVIEMESSK